MEKSLIDQKELSWLEVLRSIWYFLKGSRLKFAFWTSTLSIIYFYQLIPPLIIGQIIDFFTDYQKGASLTLFYTYVALLGGLNAATSIIRLTAKNKLAQLGTDLNYRVKVLGFERLVDFSLSWHSQENAGNKIQRIQNGISAFSDLRRVMSHDGFDTLAVFIGVLLVFLFLKPAFFLFFVVYLIIFFGINAYFYRRMFSLNEEFNKKREASTGSFYEGLSNVLTIKTLGAKDTFKQNIYGAEQKTKELSYRIIALGIGKWKLFQLLNALAISTYLLIIGQNLIIGAITIGSVFIFYSYLMKLLDAAGLSTDIFEHLIEDKAAIVRMMPIYWQEEKEIFGKKAFPKLWQEIKIRNGRFNYRGRPHKEKGIFFEINNLNLTIKNNEYLGIAGSSGSGKSTLAKLLMGLYQLKGGTFKIDQVDYYDINHDEITQNMAIVLQETEMFNLSLLENITLLKNVEPGLLEKVIRIAQLQGIIDKLPNGISTAIGERGYQLSGGERQRVGIARAIYKNPGIIVLDEATSALDNETESLIHKAIESELTNKTLIVIAHRVTTLKNMDRICVFSDGKIVEEGTYSNLINNPNSMFAKVSLIEKERH